MVRATQIIEIVEKSFGGPTIMYHGTSSIFLRKILKIGLVPDPRDKTWQDDPNMGFHRASRASFPGVYFTENMMTAYSAGGNTVRKFGGNVLIIVAQIQQRSALIDEDEIVYTIEHGGPFNNEALVLELYKDMYGDPSSDRKYFHDYTRKVYANWLKTLFINMPVDARAIRPDVAMNLFKAILRRKASYLSRHFSGSSLYGMNFPVPEQAEREYRVALDAFIKNVKQMAVNRGRDQFSHNVRVTEPVTYRGANRILAVYEELKDEAKGYREAANIKIHYGMGYPDFVRQWKSRIGTDIRWVR